MNEMMKTAAICGGAVVLAIVALAQIPVLLPLRKGTVIRA
jgi:hypothetical protein